MDNSCRSPEEGRISLLEMHAICKSYPKPVHLREPSKSSSDLVTECSSEVDALQETLLLSKSREASYHLQELIDSSSTDEIGKFLDSLGPLFQELCEDKYGNYAVQSLILRSTLAQRLKLLETCQHWISDLSFHPSGTHAIQVLADLAETPEENRFFQEQLKGNVLQFATHQHAIYVLLKLLKKKYNRYTYLKEILGHVHTLATHKVGICAVKALVHDPQIAEEMLGNLTGLMQDPYGNYAVQMAIDLWREEISFPINCALKGKVVQLCVQKYASNVIETCLKVPEVRELVLTEILERMKPVLASPFGAYVLKSALRAASPQEKDRLVYAIKKVDRKSMCKNFKAIWDECAYDLR